MVCIDDDSECTNVTIHHQEVDHWLYKEVTQLDLPLHRHFRAAIGVCTYTKCIKLSQEPLPISEYTAA